MRSRARREGGAGDLADFLAVGREDRRPRRRFGRRRVELESREPFGDAATAAMEDADDDLLADIAALRRADRAIQQARFERDGLVGHVHAEGGPAGLDPQPPRAPRARSAVAPARSRRGLDAGGLISRHEHIEHRPRLGVVCTRHERRCRRRSRASGARPSSRPASIAECTGHGVCRPVPITAICDTAAETSETATSSEKMRASKRREQASGQARRHFGEEMIATLMDPQVGDHATLRGQIRRIHALAGVERGRRRC